MRESQTFEGDHSIIKQNAYIVEITAVY